MPFRLDMSSHVKKKRPPFILLTHFISATQIHDTDFQFDMSTQSVDLGIGIGIDVKFAPNSVLMDIVDSMQNFTRNIDTQICMDFFMDSTLEGEQKMKITRAISRKQRVV